MKVKVKNLPRTLQKSYGRCISIGEAISEASSHLDVAQDIVWHMSPKPKDPFPWRTISGATQGLRNLKKEAPQLGTKIEKVLKDTKALQSLVYHMPTKKERINRKFNAVMDGFLDLRRSARKICADPPRQPLT